MAAMKVMSFEGMVVPVVPEAFTIVGPSIAIEERVVAIDSVTRFAAS
jgi:hypothetical protein